MRFVNLYLIGYVVFVLGSCWRCGRAAFVNEIAPVWIGISVIIAIGIGIMMSVGIGEADDDD